jgi:hypothetical protein
MASSSIDNERSLKMPSLQNYPIAIQATLNSCWAAAARSINNFFQSLGQSGQNPPYPSDQALATAWAVKTRDIAHADINVQQSAAAALGDLGFGNNTDDHPLPTQAEITAWITANKPLLAIVGPVPPNPSPNTDYQDGHWVVIVGISADQARIDVFDPDNGRIHTVAYNAATYGQGPYWQNCSYVDPHP